MTLEAAYIRYRLRVIDQMPDGELKDALRRGAEDALAREVSREEAPCTRP